MREKGKKNLIQIIFTLWALKCKSQIKDVWNGNWRDWEGISSSRGYIYVCSGCERDMLDSGNGADLYLNTAPHCHYHFPACFFPRLKRVQYSGK